MTIDDLSKGVSIDDVLKKWTKWSLTIYRKMLKKNEIFTLTTSASTKFGNKTSDFIPSSVKNH